jgi:uncharacterized protein YdeI (YjbR/CyaY-like superfamily)
MQHFWSTHKRGLTTAYPCCFESILWVVAIEREQVFFNTRESLRAWLAENHQRESGIWAQFYKKSSGMSDLSWEALVEECLCFGWIDSLPGKVDELRTQIYIAPRKIDSGWSRRNKLLLIDLEQRGLIEDPGFHAIERAKANGSWGRFDLAEALVIAPDLEHAFARDPEFFERWKSLTESKQRQFLQQIYDAKTEATRSKRIDAVRQSI